jgi:hypothetical protein
MIDMLDGNHPIKLSLFLMSIVVVLVTILELCSEGTFVILLGLRSHALKGSFQYILVLFTSSFTPFIKGCYWLNNWITKTLFVTKTSFIVLISYMIILLYLMSIYATLIQDMKYTFHHNWSVSIVHSIREENMCVDFLAKLRASYDTYCLFHFTPLQDLSFLSANSFGIWSG